jgi:hypothetical protein
VRAKEEADSTEWDRLEIQRASLISQRQANIERRWRLQSRPGKEVTEQIEEETRSGKWKDRVTVFASIVGLAITATVNVILSLAGVVGF